MKFTKMNLSSGDTLQGDTSVRTFNLIEKPDFTKAAISGIVSLYISVYEHMLDSKKAMYPYKEFINNSKNIITSYLTSCPFDQKVVLEQILNTMREFENSTRAKSSLIDIPKIDIAKLNLFLGDENTITGFINFYEPFLMCLNRGVFSTVKDNDSQFFSPYAINLFIVNTKNDKYLNVVLNEVPNNITFKVDSIRSGIPFVDYIFSFKFDKNTPISFFNLLSFFKLFKCQYLPDAVDNIGLGIFQFTIFDLFGGKFISKKFDFMNHRILHYKTFRRYFIENNIALSNIESEKAHELGTSKLIGETIFHNLSGFLEDTLSAVSVENFKFYSVGKEEAGNEEEENEEITDENTDTGDDNDIDTDNTEGENTDTPEEGDQTEDTMDDPAENTPDDAAGDDNQETELEQKPVIKRPNILGFKIELADEGETIEDVTYKRFAYNHINNLYLHPKATQKLKSLMMIINNQWLFLMNVKSVKAVVKNLEKLLKPSNN